MSQERFKLERVVMEDVDEIAAMVQASSQSPRITLEFQDCDRADFLAWNKAGAVSELEGCLTSEGRAEMWKMVDYVDPEKPKIVGVSVWGWDEEVVDKLFGEKAGLPLPKGTKLGLRKKFMTEIKAMEEKHRPKGKYFGSFKLHSTLSQLSPHKTLKQNFLNSPPHPPTAGSVFLHP
ncbi:hypothetical protein BJ875DRAFT_450870 [Amylocarpus encephaloides]|uniref:Uncharacterized protein n=1 Tax=Amylocarpus encephaloides TaxID=45428 RepID=A0A9P8C9I3_9HELO|nr:hypothetical protein BJ875DRAFT_450870 [Amylocarpus encephaloides]